MLFRSEVVLVERPDIKLVLCGSRAAKDPNVRQALIDRWGGDSVAVGGKKCPECRQRRTQQSGCGLCRGSGWEHPKGVLYGIGSHVWSALAVAVWGKETGKAG